MKGGGCRLINLSMRGSVLMKLCARSPIGTLPIIMNKPTPARMTASRSLVLYLIRQLWERAIQPFLPTSVSHSSSGASCAKWSACCSTSILALRSSRGKDLPRSRSVKKISSMRSLRKCTPIQSRKDLSRSPLPAREQSRRHLFGKR